MFWYNITRIRQKYDQSALTLLARKNGFACDPDERYHGDFRSQGWRGLGDFVFFSRRWHCPKPYVRFVEPRDERCPPDGKPDDDDRPRPRHPCTKGDKSECLTGVASAASTAALSERPNTAPCGHVDIVFGLRVAASWLEWITLAWVLLVSAVWGEYIGGVLLRSGLLSSSFTRLQKVAKQL